jgi:hypothetical protein
MFYEYVHLPPPHPPKLQDYDVKFLIFEDFSWTRLILNGVRNMTLFSQPFRWLESYSTENVENVE